jgi:hypothetical protein
LVPAGIRKKGVVEKAAIKQAAGCVSTIGAWGGSGQKSLQGYEVKKRDEHGFEFLKRCYKDCKILNKNNY